MKFELVCVLFLAASGAAWAQGSGSVGPPPGGGDGGLQTPFEVVKTVSVKYLSAGGDGNSIIVEAEGKKLSMKLDKRYKIKANKGTEFAGKKRIELADLQAGILLKVTYRVSDMTAIELRILQEKKA